MQINNRVQFSVLAHAAWAPGLVTRQEWLDWANATFDFSCSSEGNNEPPLVKMPALLRRRAGLLGKMALEAAYQCLDEQKNIPTVFCSRHGDVARAMELLINVVKSEALSPTHFGLAVHNATAGLFSIARKDQANHIALSSGQSTIEHGVIEACSLLADGADKVLLVSYDTCLPPLFSPYEDCQEQPHAWSWLMTPAAQDVIQLSWSAVQNDMEHGAPNRAELPASLQVLKFYLRNDPLLTLYDQQRQWHWSRGA